MYDSSSGPMGFVVLDVTLPSVCDGGDVVFCHDGVEKTLSQPQFSDFDCSYVGWISDIPCEAVISTCLIKLSSQTYSPTDWFSDII